MAAKKENGQAENMVEILLERPRKGEDTHQFVSVNGKTYLVKKGEPVKVPRCVAEVLANAMAARNEQDAYEAENSRLFAAEQNG